MTRPLTEGSELPSLWPALPRFIYHHTSGRGGGERGDTTEEEWGFLTINLKTPETIDRKKYLFGAFLLSFWQHFKTCVMKFVFVFVVFFLNLN